VSEGVVSVAGLYDFMKFVATGTNLFYHLINWLLGRGGVISQGTVSFLSCSQN